MFDNSYLASGHHFYVSFFETNQIRSSEELYKLFDQKKSKEELDFSKDLITHFQIALAELYGLDTALAGNQVKINGRVFFWYDFYLGKFLVNSKQVFFICYPYKGLGKFVDGVLLAKKIKRKYYKPLVPDILKFMKSRGWMKKAENLEKSGNGIAITKYTAQIKEEANAKKVNLIGNDPLNSKIYDILNSVTEITIEPVSLKLSCKRASLGELELAFDKLGNFRFWMKRDQQNKTLPILHHTFQFLYDAGALELSEFIVSQTFLEDDTI